MSLSLSRDSAFRRFAVLLASLLVSSTPVAATSAPSQTPSGTAGTDTTAVQTGDGASVPILRGQVVLDGVGVPDNPVTLHRVTSQASGEVASTVTDRDGYFQFPVPNVEGTDFTVYFATADYLSVRFFGDPLHADSAATTDYRVVVYDTASVLPEPLRIASRDMFLIGNLLGGWEVFEVVQVLNPTSVALVATEGNPAFEFRIPEGASDFQVGEGDVLPHELTWMEDRVLQITPVTPGTHQIFISYRLPEGPATSSLLIEQPTDTMNVFVRQPSHLTGITGLQTTRVIQFEGDEFLLYGAQNLEPGARITFEWSGPEGPPVDPVVAAVAVTVILLGIGVFAALRNRAQPG